MELIEKDTPITQEVLELTAFETIQSKKVTELNWNKSDSVLGAWRLDTTFFNTNEENKEFQNNLSNKNKRERRLMVNLKLVSLRWMFQDGKNFCDLVCEF